MLLSIANLIQTPLFCYYTFALVIGVNENTALRTLVHPNKKIRIKIVKIFFMINYFKLTFFQRNKYTT